MIVRVDIKFGLYTDFLDRTLAAEDSRLPNESIEDGVIRVHEALERAAVILKKRVAATVTDGFIQDANYKAPPSTLTTTNNGPAVIDLQAIREKENLEIAIDNATSLEDLAKLKEQVGKQGLIHPYMQKMNQLMSQPKEFTDGIE